jgi:surfeit locus 1 family protein
MSSIASPDGSRPGFHPGVVATVCTLLALTLLLALGTWQVQRLQWKTDILARAHARFDGPAIPLQQAVVDPAASDFAPVAVQGRYRHDLAFAMGTYGVGGLVGARLVTPLETGDGRLLLVERGWLPQDRLPPNAPADLGTGGEVSLIGHARDRSGEQAGPFTPDNQPDRRRWFWYDLPALEAALGAPVLPLVLTLDEPDATGALQPMPLQIDLPNNHLGYAITWYGLAVALLAVYFAFGLRRSGD